MERDQIPVPGEICNCGALRRATRHVSLMYDRVLAGSGPPAGNTPSFGSFSGAEKHRRHSANSRRPW